MPRIALFCVFVVLSSGFVQQGLAAPPLPPLKVELTREGRARIQRISSWAIPSSDAQPFRMPGGIRSPSLSVLELNNVSLPMVLEASQSPQRVELQGKEHLPGGYYHIDVFLWNDEQDWDHHLFDSLSSTFNLVIRKSERQDPIYLLRERRPDDVLREARLADPKPQVITFSFSLGPRKKKADRQVNWNARPEQLAGNLSSLLGRSVINQIEGKQRLPLKLTVKDPLQSDDIVRQCFEQNLVLEEEQRPVVVLTVEPIEQD